MRESARYAMSNLENQTQFTKNFEQCDGSTDVIWVRVPGIVGRGKYQCIEDGSGPECLRAQVLLDPNQLNDDLNRDKTSCHEVPHSGGLSHHDNDEGCMKSGEVTEGHRHYSDHHVGHLNQN